MQNFEDMYTRVAAPVAATGVLAVDALAVPSAKPSAAPLAARVLAVDALAVAQKLPQDAVCSLTDDALLAEISTMGDVRKASDAYVAKLAGELTRRSDPALGYQGLAARSGFKSPAALIQGQTGSTGREATTLVAAGTLTENKPWLTPVAEALRDGKISATGARAIRDGLGDPSEEVDAGTLQTAAVDLLAKTMDDDERGRRARDARDDLDQKLVEDREKTIHQARSFKVILLANGMKKYILTADIESAAQIDAIITQLMSPRRGGPRFVDPEQQAWAHGVANDTRTPDQYLHDAITELLRQGATAGTKESRKVMGSKKPTVKVLVTKKALETGKGVGRIENQPLPISLASVERIICADGTQEITFDQKGQILDLGREQRFFTPAQRIALAARDGGCRVCGRPASECEGHHLHWWSKGGTTDISIGILLCRYHHMLIHNNGWTIKLDDDGDFWLIPPNTVDPNQTPKLLPSHSRALDDLMAEQAHDETPSTGTGTGTGDHDHDRDDGAS